MSDVRPELCGCGHPKSDHTVRIGDDGGLGCHSCRCDGYGPPVSFVDKPSSDVRPATDEEKQQLRLALESAKAVGDRTGNYNLLCTMDELANLLCRLDAAEQRADVAENRFENLDRVHGNTIEQCMNAERAFRAAEARIAELEARLAESARVARQVLDNLVIQDLLPIVASNRLKELLAIIEQPLPASAETGTLGEGKVWAAIRRRLPDLEDSMRKALDAQRYEEASIYWDGIARKLAAAVAEEKHRLPAPPAAQSATAPPKLRPMPHPEQDYPGKGRST